MTEVELDEVIQDTLASFARARGEHARLVESLTREAAKGNISRGARQTIKFRADRLSAELAGAFTSVSDFVAACRKRMQTIADQMGG